MTSNFILSRLPMTLLVGLGGSAGSIQPLLDFFKAMPLDNNGMAFVVVIHLSPTYESKLAHILQAATTMPVAQAIDGEAIAPNHVYVIPPGKYLAVVNGHLQLAPLEREFGKLCAVDVFFRSLADNYGPNAVAIVLSGMNGDGATGIMRTKERGGLTIAQDPDRADHPRMPRLAIETGMIDWVLTPAQMPDRLIAYRDNATRLSAAG